MQNTLAESITLRGIGLHSGKTITLVLYPASENTGIVFVRSDVKSKDNTIPARWDRVVDTQLCTVIGNAEGVSVGTIEHLMSALRGLEIDNVRIVLDGPEVPVMDGSAMPFVTLIEEAGIVKQTAPRRLIRVLKKICVEQEGKKVTLAPAGSSIFGGEIAFSHPQIGRQVFEIELSGGVYKEMVADSRTFGFLQEVEWMRSKGLALGGSLDNAVVLNETTVINPEGLRHADEFVRHKILDAIGDLYLAGVQILGAYHGFKGGHAMNNGLLHALFSDESAYEIVELYDHLPIGASSLFMMQGVLNA